MRDGHRLDARAWRAIVTASLVRSGEGIVVCDDELEIVFATRRARSLLERLGAGAPRMLPEPLAEVARSMHDASSESSLSKRLAARRGAVHVHVARLRDAAPAVLAIWLREESLRDERLYSLIEERAGISRRSFQLAQLLREGLTNREIARELGLTEATVKIYLYDLYRACDVSSRTALVALLERLAKTRP